MQRDSDLFLNVSCSRGQNGVGQAARKLPQRMPDGSKIESNFRLTKKITKTHQPAVSSGAVFIPRHKLPVLDEFGLSTFATPREEPKKKPAREQNEQTKSEDCEVTSKANGELKRRKRKKPSTEPKIIPKEVQLVAGGLPSSFPKHRIKKFTEEYQLKKKRQAEEDDDDNEQVRKKRRSYVPGLNPRKREKAASLFTDTKLDELHDLHPYLVQNLEQNFEIQKLTRIQSLAMPVLLKTRFNSDSRVDLIVNSGIGSGKILSYVVPILNNLALMEPKIDRTAGIYALVLLPTRELAAKISEIFSKLCRSFLWVVPGLLTGGERKKSEKARLRKGLNILITTPGRLIDHMDHSEKMDFSKMRYCVLGDAHRLLDPERAEVSKKIAILLRKRLPHNCVRCVVTATLTKKLDKFCEIILEKPTIIDAFKEFE